METSSEEPNIRQILNKWIAKSLAISEDIKKWLNPVFD